MNKLIDIVESQITGEWGLECEDDTGVNVLRTTNFTNIGIINYSNVAKRKISDKKIEFKKLTEGDIILEKSGGSDNIPVGRVVYCDAKINEQIYLCNNFTQTLRINKKKAIAKYVFYFLMFQHKRGYTNLLQNKTTGIRNLKLKEYMNMLVPILSIEQQIKIVEIFDKITYFINLRIKQIEKLDLLIKSQFVEMFGTEKYPIVKTEEVCQFITKGTTPKIGEIIEEYKEGFIPYLKAYNLSFDGQILFDEKTQYINKNIHDGILVRSKVYPNDVLMNIVGPPLGKFALIPNTYKELNINQAIAIFRATDKVVPRYLLNALMQPKVLKPFIDLAVGIRQQNLSLLQCRNLEIPLPPIELQICFSDFVKETDKQKFELQDSLNKLNTLYSALLQKYFN